MTPDACSFVTLCRKIGAWLSRSITGARKWIFTLCPSSPKPAIGIPSSRRTVVPLDGERWDAPAGEQYRGGKFGWSGAHHEHRHLDHRGLLGGSLCTHHCSSPCAPKGCPFDEPDGRHPQRRPHPCYC